MNALLTPEGRRAAAFGAALGGCVVMTIFAAFGLWWLRSVPVYTFWLAIAAHAQIAIVLTGFIGMFIKRHIEAGKDGLKISDIAEGQP